MFTSIKWNMVCREQQRRAVRDAQREGAMLYYVQAVDTKRHVETDRETFMRMLQIPNMTKTGRLMGLLPLFVGMKVRVTRRIAPALGIVQEATGTRIRIRIRIGRFGTS